MKIQLPDGSVQEYDDARAKLLIEKRGYKAVEPTRPPDELGVKTPKKKASKKPADVAAVSKDVNALVAISAIFDIIDSETLNAYVVDETRTTVLRAAEDQEAKMQSNAV